MEQILNGLLLLCILIGLYFLIKQNKDNFINLYNSENSKIIKNNKVQFNYDDTVKQQRLNNEFLKEQEQGTNMNTVYPNTWIETVQDGVSIYNSRDKNKDNTIKPFELTPSKVRFSYEFNEPKVSMIDSAININDNKTIKEIYDNSFVDYKKLVQKKKHHDVIEEIIPRKAASELSYINPDMWLYDNEKQENGGEILDGLFAYDAMINNTVAIY